MWRAHHSLVLLGEGIGKVQIRRSFSRLATITSTPKKLKNRKRETRFCHRLNNYRHSGSHPRRNSQPARERPAEQLITSVGLPKDRNAGPGAGLEGVKVLRISGVEARTIKGWRRTLCSARAFPASYARALIPIAGCVPSNMPCQSLPRVAKQPNAGISLVGNGDLLASS